MNPTLIRALALVGPVGLLLIVSVAALLKSRSLPAALQLIGAACLLLVVLAHICEGLHWFQSMQWGERHSAGHYLDLAGAGLGITLFPVGYLLRLRRLAVTRRAEDTRPPRKAAQQRDDADEAREG